MVPQNGVHPQDADADKQYKVDQMSRSIPEICRTQAKLRLRPNVEDRDKRTANHKVGVILHVG
jgi:hypothetical protein